MSNLTLGLLLQAALMGLLLPGDLKAQPTTNRVSVGPGGAQGDGASSRPAISADGRWVAFVSWAGNLVADDTNFSDDVFLHDRMTGATTRVSVGPGGLEAGWDSDHPAISADGRLVAFDSWAGNLVYDDTNRYADVFVHDRLAATTTRISVGPGGVEANASSFNPTISADGRWVAFESWADNLVADDTNGSLDVFVHDRNTGTTTQVSVGPDGTQGNSGSRYPAISADGRWIAFSSYATNLIPNDTNNRSDVFVYDQQTRTTTRVSVRSDGLEGDDHSSPDSPPAISADGRWIAFESRARNFAEGDTYGSTDVFVHDWTLRTTTRVSETPAGAQADDISLDPDISADGRLMTFYSWASNLVPGDTNGMADVFVFELDSQVTTRVSLGTEGAEGNSISTLPSTSADGRLVVFASFANNLVADDTNGMMDVFVHERHSVTCPLTLAPASEVVPAAGVEGQLLVMSPAGCAWTAVSDAPAWLTVTHGAGGAGFGLVQYRVAANGGAERIATIGIGERTFTASQMGAMTPMAPENLRAHLITGATVTLRWTVPTGGPAPTGFVLEGGLNPGEVLASLRTDSEAPTFTFAAPAGSFYVRLHALNGGLRSAPSNEIRLHVNVPVAPSPPHHLLGMVNGSTVALTWINTFAGGPPASLVLDVWNGPTRLRFHLPLNDNISFSGVPGGYYAVALRALNEGGLSQSTSGLYLVVPGPCTGPPLVPARLLLHRAGRTVSVDWSPAMYGPAPTSYALHVTGSLTRDFTTSARTLSGTVAPGTYTVRVTALNPCGASAATAPQTVTVP